MGFADQNFLEIAGDSGDLLENAMINRRLPIFPHVCLERTILTKLKSPSESPSDNFGVEYLKSRSNLIQVFFKNKHIFPMGSSMD